MRRVWQDSQSSGLAENFAGDMRLSKLLANILVSRGYDTKEKIYSFLYSDRQDLSSPFSLINMASAVERIEEAINCKEKITIYGDYDVDGFCAATLLKRALNYFYSDVDIYIPNRIEEGYGLNQTALQEILSSGTKLVITVDCGISSHQLIEEFMKQGLDFIVTDHHQLPEIIPQTIVINPLLAYDSGVPFYNLCGCGVAFMLALGLSEYLKADKEKRKSIGELIDIVAIATVADIMPLTEDNRILVKEGIKQIQKKPRVFLKSMLDILDLESYMVDSEIIGFQIAPRINACGRLNEINLGIDFLLEDDPIKNKLLAKKVEDLNNLRRKMVEEIWKSALKQIDEEKQDTSIAVITVGDYHVGVLGIVASKLVDKFGVPALVLTKNEGGYVGSGRSIKGFHLQQALQANEKFLSRFGGHAMAAGFSLEEEMLSAFRQEFINYVKDHYINDEKDDVLDVVNISNFLEINENLYQQLSLLEPTGHANLKPVLAMYGLKNLMLKSCGTENQHLQLMLGDLRGIGFNQAEHLSWYQINENVDMAFQLKKSYFRGKERLEFILRDLQPSCLSTNQLDEVLFLDAQAYLTKDEYLDIELKKSFFTNIAGVSFYDRQEKLKNLEENATLYLIREIDNPIDPNAIIVANNGETLGYLKKDLAKHLAPLIDNGVEYHIKNWQLTGGELENKYYGLNIEISSTFSEIDIAVIEEKKYSDEDIRQNLLPNASYTRAQEEALKHLRNQKNTLALMPTGRGKSLIFQTRALELARENKITLVISPLRSLIADQYLKLKELTLNLPIQVTKITGDMSFDEKEVFKLNYAAERYDVVFTTPEFYCANEIIFKSSNIGLVVVDEAHYLTSRRWGYKNLSEKLESIVCPRLALTATADEMTYQMIIEKLAIEKVITDNYEKTNLQIVDHRQVENKLGYLLLLASKGEKTIIYVNSKKGAYELAKKIREEVAYNSREKIGYYHGGLPKLVRNEIEHRFRKGEYQVLVATTAFGEGIDIPDIKHVVFFHLPFSKESFNQLAGRGGRKEDKAYIHLLYGKRDESLNDKILSILSPTREMLGDLYSVLKMLLAEKDVLAFDTNTLFRILSKKNYYFDIKQVKIGLDIFLELQLIEVFKDGHQKMLRLLPQKSKLQLNDSQVYLEGLMEREAFKALLDLAFQKDTNLIKDMLSHIIAPIREEV